MLGFTDTDSQIVQRRWANSSFLKPLQLSGQLSGFPYLHMLYGIFSCLPVSSASAERALSKLKIVKNRLRTSLSDDNLSALLVLASEKRCRGTAHKWWYHWLFCTGKPISKVAFIALDCTIWNSVSIANMITQKMCQCGTSSINDTHYDCYREFYVDCFSVCILAFTVVDGQTPTHLV